jgi:chaperonin cofactor prefoldin
MPGAFDYSKWDNIDTSSSDDEQDVPSSADAMQALHDYAFAQGMDEELITDTLMQCGGDPQAALEYLIDFLEMDGVAPTPAPAPAKRPAPRTASSPPLGASAAAPDGRHGTTTGGAAALSTWELQEEMAAGLQQIQELQQKRDGNSSALSALARLEAARRPHQRSDQKSNRQWVNMGDLFVKLPQQKLEATLTKDQHTIDEETAALSRQHQLYSTALTQRRTLGGR